MEKRTKVNMKLVSAATKGRLHVDDISICLMMCKIDNRIFDIMQNSKVAK